jgi:hypothetical protein
VPPLRTQWAPRRWRTGRSVSCEPVRNGVGHEPLGRHMSR